MVVELSDHTLRRFRASTTMPRCATVRILTIRELHSLSTLQTLAEAPMRSLTKAIRLVGFIAMFLACLPLLAQTYTGRILGTVTDQTGAALTGAQVMITDVQRGV